MLSNGSEIDNCSHLTLRSSQVFGDKQSLEYNDFNELKYLDDFIKEVLRYHPIVSSVARETGPSGFILCDKYIPGNTTVHINIECVQVCQYVLIRALDFHFSKIINK